MGRVHLDRANALEPTQYRMKPEAYAILRLPHGLKRISHFGCFRRCSHPLTDEAPRQDTNGTT